VNNNQATGVKADIQKVTMLKQVVQIGSPKRRCEEMPKQTTSEWQS
jgi:hypothetical protein